MEVRLLKKEERQLAAGLSRFVFDNYLRNRMEFEQTISFVEQYLSLENLDELCENGKLLLWGAFEGGMFMGVSGMHTDGMITILYIHPDFQRRRYASELLFTMKQYAKDVLHLETVTINANPAWTYTYFLKQGFFTKQEVVSTNVPFIPMYAKTKDASIFHKRYISGKTHALVILGCLVSATLLGIGFMVGYMF